MFEEERKKASFDKRELSYIIYDGKEKLEAFLQRQKLIANDPILCFDPATLHRSRAQLMSIYAKKVVRYTEIISPGPHKFPEKAIYFPEQLPLGLHEAMFLPTLRNLCDEQQRKLFLEPAQKCQIIGCYAQTQLGHGSDVKGLMTTATFDQTSDTFILNTPDVKAAKWWIGDLGVFATHACLFAQLIIKKKNYGVHAFVVEIRDKEHKPLLGVQIGDIGPKFGYNCKDNGYLIFSNVKIPRRNMLMKYHRVSRQGHYQVVGNEKITYATMLKVRSFIPTCVLVTLSKATTILVRFSLVRRQFKDNKGIQIPILDYQIQQEKVLPRVAQTFANVFAVRTIDRIADQVLSEARNDDYSRLNQAHVLTSAIKAITTRDGLNGMQILRRAGGGHGYHAYSGIPGLQVELAPTYTFQGDFTILMLQVARYLIKTYNRIQRGSKKIIGVSVQYMKHLEKQTKFTLNTDDYGQLRNPDNILKVFINNSCYRIKRAGQKLLQGVSNGIETKKTWDEFAGLELVECGIAHSYFCMVDNFNGYVKKVKDENTRKALQRLFLLYSIEKISDNSTSFFETESITSVTLKALRQVREKLFTEIRPDALTLVQAFEYNDNSLMSAIGSSDGKAYENLMRWAKQCNDVNRPQVAAQFRNLNKTLKKFHHQMQNSKL